MKDTTISGHGSHVIYGECSLEVFARSLLFLIERHTDIEFASIEWEEGTKDRIEGFRFDIEVPA